LVGLGVCGAPTALGEEGPDLRSPDLVRRGQTLFSETCTYCHGENAAAGSSGAPGFQGRSDLTAQAVFNTISNGRIRGTNIMPAWKESLSEGERWALTAYILSVAASPGESK
jgi:mono/diheme cytochrome c family protein